MLAVLSAGSAAAQSSANLLLVNNSSSPTSEVVGKYYAGKRGIVQDNICSIQVAATETIARDVYVNQIETPIWR
jgi:uncharacterized protein (TIGR03790 family)